MIIIKLAIILASLLLLAAPFLPIRWPLALYYYKGEERERKKNLVNLLAVCIAALAVIIFFPWIRNLAMWLGSLKPVAWVIDKIPVYTRYSTQMAVTIFSNVFYCVIVLICLGAASLGVKGCGRVAGKIKEWRRKRAERKKSGKKDKKEKKDKSKKRERRKKKDKDSQSDPSDPDKDKDKDSDTDPDKDKNKDSDTNQDKDKNKDNGTGQDKDKDKDNGQTPQPTPGPMPPELLPTPEERTTGNRFMIPGEQGEGKADTKKKSGEGKKKDDKKAAPAGPQTLKARVKGVLLENVQDGWYMRPQILHVIKHLRNFLILVSAAYIVCFTLLLLPVMFRIRFLEEPFYSVMQFFVGANYLYPTIALSILLEVYWLLEGRAAPVEPTEAETDPEGIEHGSVVDLDALEADLMKTMGKSYDVSSFYSGDVAPVTHERTKVDSDSPMLRSVAEYVRSQDLELDNEYLLGLKYFQEGRNVLFYAPLYTAVGPYIFAELDLRIAQGQRVVVICNNRSEVSNIIDALSKGLRNVTRTKNPLWRIIAGQDLTADSDADVVVLTPQDFRNDKLFVTGRQFFRRVTVAMLPDADLVLAANNYYCLIISQRLSQYCKRGMQYLFLSTRNTENLDNFLTEYFLLPSTPESARGDYSYVDAHIYVWRAKRDTAVLLDNAAQTMLPEVVISNIASHHNIPTPTIISDGAIYSNQVNVGWLALYDATDRPLGFAVVSDDCFNLPGVIYAYSRYLGRRTSVIHVLTRPYLLRNYFFANASRYLFEEPLMQRSMTKHAAAAKSQMVLLMCRLMEGLPLSVFFMEMDRILGRERGSAERSFDDIAELVEECLTISTGQKPSDTNEHFTIFTPTDVFYPEPYIRIREDYDVLSGILRDTALVQVRFGGARPPAYLNIFAKMLDQRYLVEQNLVYANKNYRIRSIDRENGIIYVTDATSTHGLARDYTQIRSYELTRGDEFKEDCRRISEREKTECQGVKGTKVELTGEDSIVRSIVMVRSQDAFEVVSKTLGYYVIDTDGAPGASVPIIWLNKGSVEEMQRKVGAGMYLRIDMDRGRDDRLTMTLAALLQEMMKTLFPDVYFCLSVCPILADPESVYEGGDARSRAIAQLYPQLTNWGPVAENSIELLIIEDCEGGVGAMDLLYEEDATFLRNIFWMLDDYLQWQKENEPVPYLYYGRDSEPRIFDIASLRPIMQAFARSYVREHDIASEMEAVNRCELCGRPLDESILRDGRVICRRCSEERVPTQDEAARILRYAQDFLRERFGVELEDFTVEFSPALGAGTLSRLDLDQRVILLAEHLPLTALHVEVIGQLTRAWQLENLDLTGDPEVDGQCPYVTLQYLRYLEQHQYAQLLHRRYLLGRDDVSRGYCLLNQNLQTEGHDNSFQYLLHREKKRDIPPHKDYVKKKSTRVTEKKDLTYYYRSQLSEPEQEVYEAVLKCYMDHAESVDVSAGHLTTKRFGIVHTSVIKDHPEIFWTNGAYTWVTANDIVQTVKPVYTTDAETRARLQKEIEDTLAPFIAEVTEGMEDYEVALKIYERVIKMLDYDTIELERQQRSGSYKIDVMDNLRNIYGAIVRHKAVCAGYAKAFQYLLQMFGIETLYVCGDCFIGGLHAWNIVKLEGEYYHVDVTWGDYSNTDPARSSKGMSYAYFAITDEQIKNSRSIEAEPAPPRCTAEDCNYFVRQNLYFTRYDAAQMRETLTEKFKDPETDFVEMRFATLKLMRDAEYFLCRNGGMHEVLRAAGRQESSFVYSKRDDLGLLKIILKN